MRRGATTTSLPLIRLFMTTDTVGGVWNYTLALAEGLVRLGCDCVVATVGPRATQIQKDAANCAGVELIETDLPLDWASESAAEIETASRALSDLGRSTRPDSIHLHTPSFANTMWHAPVVAVAHSCMATWWAQVFQTPLERDFVWRKKVHHEGMLAAECVVAPSASFANALIDEYGPIRTLRVVHNGAKPAGNSSIVRGVYGLCAGRLWDSGKNFKVLDDAAECLDFKSMFRWALSRKRWHELQPSTFTTPRQPNAFYSSRILHKGSFLRIVVSL